jgi:hypothetical protein
VAVDAVESFGETALPELLDDGVVLHRNSTKWSPHLCITLSSEFMNEIFDLFTNFTFSDEQNSMQIIQN